MIDDIELLHFNDSFILNHNQEQLLSNSYPSPLPEYENNFPKDIPEIIINKEKNIKENKNINVNKANLEKFETGFTSKKNNDQLINDSNLESQKNLSHINRKKCTHCFPSSPENQQSKNTNNDNNNITSNKTKLLGRKKKESNESGEHNKFSDDNLIRKCKSVVLKYIFIFINNMIKSVYQYNIDNGVKVKQLLKINYNQIKKSKVLYNKAFLNKKLKDIFSDNISTKYRNHSKNHNKNLINNLLNEKDEEKRKIFEKIFNLTFLECLQYFRGSISIKELDGMTNLDEACENFEGKEDFEYYKELFKSYINQFEKIIRKKKERHKREK